MAVYRTPTDINMSKGYTEILNYINDVTNSWFSNMILVAIFVITAMGIYGYRKDFGEAFSSAGFFTAIIAVLFWVAGFINGLTLGIVIAVAIVGVASLWISKR